MRITADVDGNKYYVKFRHFRDVVTNLPYATKCYIEDAKTMNVLYEGFTLCSEKDNFNYEIGRKIALSRALGAIERAKRINFWKAYFDRYAQEWRHQNGTV